MENNENGNLHDEHNLDGDRQSYPKGWWMPLVGLLVIALGFTAIGTFAFSVSGTDRWGKTEQCEMKDGKCCTDDKSCAEGKEAKDDKECKDGGGCKDDKNSKKMEQRDPIYRNKTSVGW